jgi:hypothetical protein
MYSVVLRPKHIAGGRKEYLGMGALFRCVTFSLRSFYFSPNGAPSVTSVARRLRTDLDSCFLLPFRSVEVGSAALFLFNQNRACILPQVRRNARTISVEKPRRSVNTDSFIHTDLARSLPSCALGLLLLHSSSCFGPENSSCEMYPSLSLSSWLKISSTSLSWSPSIWLACSACSPPAACIASTCDLR